MMMHFSNIVDIRSVHHFDFAALPIYGKNVQGPSTDALFETMLCKTTDRRCAMDLLKHRPRVVSDDAASFLPRFIQRCTVGELEPFVFSVFFPSVHTDHVAFGFV